MKQITFQGLVYATPAENYNKGDANAMNGIAYNVVGFKPSDPVGTAEVTITLLDDFDPVQKIMSDLEEKKREITEAFTAQLAAVQAQINRFTALEME